MSTRNERQDISTLFVQGRIELQLVRMRARACDPQLKKFQEPIIIVDETRLL